MSILNHIKAHELLEYKVLQQQVMKAASTEEIQHYESKIHNIFDQIEYRILIEKSIEIGRLEIIENMLRQGMTIEDVAQFTPYKISELKVKLNEPSK